MTPDPHERALRLLAAARAEGIAPAERQWLDSHLAACPQCASEASALARAIQSFRGVPVVAPPLLVARTRLRVRRRAEELRAERERMFPLWVAVALSAAWMLLTTPYTWWAFGWLGRTAGVPDAAWQLGFLLWWFLPATVLAAIAAWRYSSGPGGPLEWTENGGQS